MYPRYNTQLHFIGRVAPTLSQGWTLYKSPTFMPKYSTYRVSKDHVVPLNPPCYHVDVDFNHIHAMCAFNQAMI